MGIFKSRQVAKITACYSHFAGCSRVCPYAHILSESRYDRSKYHYYKLALSV